MSNAASTLRPARPHPRPPLRARIALPWDAAAWTASEWPWTVIRLTLAGLLAAHGWARWHADAVAPFGAFLDSQGFPAGHAIAWGITLLEIIGTPLLAIGRGLRPLTLVYSAVYATGIVLVHWQAGWFVVGLGRNGCEYSVLLIATLLCVGLRRPPQHGILRSG